MLFIIALMLAPIVILVGVFREVEGAVFFSLVVLLLLGAGWALLDLVYSKRSQESG